MHHYYVLNYLFVLVWRSQSGLQIKIRIKSNINFFFFKRNKTTKFLFLINFIQWNVTAVFNLFSWTSRSPSRRKSKHFSTFLFIYTLTYFFHILVYKWGIVETFERTSRGITKPKNIVVFSSHLVILFKRFESKRYFETVFFQLDFNLLQLLFR